MDTQVDEVPLMEWDSILKSVGNGYSVRVPTAYVKSRKMIPGNWFTIRLLPYGSLLITPKKQEAD